VIRRVLLLGGVDPCGGAGITADAIVVAAHGAWPLPIAVVLTAQNRKHFEARFEVPAPQWRKALAAALADGEVHAVKTGLLGDAACIAEVAAALRPIAAKVPIVVDPVLSATAGGLAASAAAAAAYRTHLLPLAALVTPNLSEAEALFGGDPANAFAAGCRAVLKKGGHGAGEFADDVLSQPGREVHFRRARLAVGAVHGTGCALASAIAAQLATGADVADACAAAGDWLHELLRKLGPPSPDGLPRPLPLARLDAASGTSPR
jgi:hydroxymethylpyrimidine/phosphomethylpyrimidine kinase